MERDFKFSIMRLGRSTRLTLTISLTSSIQRMVASGQLLFLCICKSLFFWIACKWISGYIHPLNQLMSFLFFFTFCRSDVEEGGETVFPSANMNISAVPWWNELSECAKQGLSLKPKMGNALLFWSTRPDATLDPSSLHG